MKFLKVGHTDVSIVRNISSSEFHTKLASDDVIDRLNKFAQTIRAIAPKSDDFLYFSIIFLKSAEACLIDNEGNLKKVGKDNAWGYFDDNWKWHGNVKPHRNNNGDIFPEAELKKATRSWIGRPLCVDHKSDTVDGVRGIILDTHYDEKLKQVVGLCALDKVNYPDLARKITTGVVRYGSMGTAVAVSVCTECSKAATSPNDFCQHIIRREAWGEINLGLSPIEYSLVVQPAEPGAILLRCFASINKHKDELKSYGFDTTKNLEQLSLKEANDLDLLLNSVCGSDGCSIDQRQRIVKGYLSTGGFTKSASTIKTSQDRKTLAKAMADFAAATGQTMSEAPELFRTFFDDDDLVLGDELSMPLGETFTSGQSASGSDSILNKDDQGMTDYTGTGSSGLIAGVTEPNPDSFKGDGVGPESYAFSKADITDTIKLSSITEDIMKESRLIRRAALRRRLAHPQGGAAPADEPSTYKDEAELQKKIREQDDRQMHAKDLGGPDGMAPGDKEVKEKLKRAEENLTTKKAYYYGGAAPAMEPATFTSEDYHKYWDADKHMHQTKSMGGDKGLFPGDEAVKTQLKRAKYEGPKLKTVIKQKRSVDGTIDKAASCLEVYAGSKLVIATTAKNIFGDKLNENWEFLISRDYANAVIAAIREDGIQVVGTNLTRTAQELPMALEEEVPATLDDEPMGLPEALPEEEELLEDEGSPKGEIEDSLIAMEDTIEQIRGALSGLGGGEDIDVNINLGEGSVDMPEEKLALSKNIFDQLKVTLAEAKDSADELALLAVTHEKLATYTSAQRKNVKDLSRSALKDFSTIVGRSKALVSLANTITDSMVKVSTFVEEAKTEVPAAAKPESDLLVTAMNLRKQRRLSIIRKAQEAVAESKEESKEEEGQENESDDGVGMKENAKISGVTTDTAEDVATRDPKGGDHTAAPSKGNADVKLFNEYPSTPARQLAEKAVQVSKADDAVVHPAEMDDAAAPPMNQADDAKMEEVAEEAAEEEVDEHEDEMHKEDDANDQLTAVQAKLGQSFLNKKAEDDKETYKIRLRRAFNIAMEMQRKGMLADTRPALNRQVDDMMEFDSKAFESFKRTVASFTGRKVVQASEGLGGFNIGIVTEEDETLENKTASDTSQNITAESLSSLFDE